MSKILNSIAAFSMATWIVGFFFYNYGPEVHLLLAAAVGLLIMKVLLDKE